MIMRHSFQVCSEHIFCNLIWLIVLAEIRTDLHKMTSHTVMTFIFTPDSKKSCRLFTDFGCRLVLWKNNIEMLSLPERQSQPPETIHFLLHYPSHSLCFAPSPFLSLEVSDTEMGNNQKSAELMPHKKHRTPDSLCMHLADLFRVVAVIPMCIFPSAEVF